MRSRSAIKVARSIIGIPLLFVSICLLVACGGSQTSPEASETCRRGVRQLKQRVGPEFNKLISVNPLPVSPPQKFGCVLIYTTVPEELPGEVIGQFISSQVGHELAFILPDYEGRLIINQAGRPKHRQGPVEMLIKLAEVHGGELPEVLVEERLIGSPDPIHSLRVFMYADGVPTPKEIFSERMSVKLDNGVERPAELLIGEFEENPSIFLKSRIRGKDRVFMWDESLQTYRYDLSATQRRALSESASKQELNPSKKPSLTPPRPPRKNTNSDRKPSSLVGLLKGETRPKQKRESRQSESPQQMNRDERAKAPVNDSPQTPSQEQKRASGDGSSKSGQEKNVTTVSEFLEGL